MIAHPPINVSFRVWTDDDQQAVTAFTVRYGRPPLHVLHVGRDLYLGPVPDEQQPEPEIPPHFLDDIAKVR